MKTALTGAVAPPLHRRRFLGVVTTGSVAGGLGCLSILGFSPHGDGVATGDLTVAAFEPHIGSRFCLCSGKNEPLRVELVEGVAHPSDPNRPPYVRRHPFTLIFHSQHEAPFSDQMCRITHPRLGTMEVFVSRVDVPEHGMNLQAVFG